MTNATNILLRHNYIEIPKFVGTSEVSQVGSEALATILMNLAYYGRALSVEGYTALVKMTTNGVGTWWADVETELKEIAGASRKIGDFVVYKNFPKEVLDKTQAEYWLPQLLMYWGFPKEMFTEEVKPREKMKEKQAPTVLKLAKKTTLGDILMSHLKSPSRWKDQDLEEVLFLANDFPINLGKVAFKENMVLVATAMMTKGLKVEVKTATDVLRLAAGLSDGDVSLREKFKFKSFNRGTRKFLLGLLEGCANLNEDVARRPELFKRLLHQLHPGEYKRQYPSVLEVANALYNNKLQTFNGKVEPLLLDMDPKVLSLLETRPGEFKRRLVHTIDIFGNEAVKSFKSIIDKLTTAQVVGLRSYLETVNLRDHRTFPPKGNWTKMQIGKPRPVDEKHVQNLSKALGKVLAERVPAVKVLDDATRKITLPSNDGEVSPYNRGTVFPIPEDVTFIRTASYWQNTKGGVTWFDNGWNFFDKDWKSVGACCWNAVNFPKSGYPSFGMSKRKKNETLVECGAIFSGDPINTAEMKGRAAQLIDLYPARLLEQGVRYAVWNILCYSRISFSQADDVFAALQWGKDAESGKLFEPSRCQLAFPLKGDSMTKYVCVIDLVTRELIYIDANLHGQVQSAGSNGPTLEKNMPAFMEYIASLPTVHDLFRESVSKKAEMQVLYSDKDAELRGNVPAYVFKPENKDSKYKPVDINNILSS